LELSFENKKPLNKEELYNLLRRIEFVRKCEKDEKRKILIFSKFEFTPSQNHNEYDFH
jgi:hypothetical protein